MTDEIKEECSKHPENFRGLSPEEFAKEFVHTNYFYQRECFKEMIKEYGREAEGDKKRGRVQLSTGLEKLSESFRIHVNRTMNDICKACRKYLKNPFYS